MLINSKFSRNVAGPLVVLVMIVGLMILIGWIWSQYPDAPLAGLIVFLIFMIGLGFLMIFGELRKRAIKVSVDSETITVRRYLGLGGEELHFFNSFDGYHCSNLEAETRAYEYLYLMREGKKVIKLSEFYHANYYDLKSAIARKVKYKGEIAYNFWREAREFFE